MGCVSTAVAHDFLVAGLSRLPRFAPHSRTHAPSAACAMQPLTPPLPFSHPPLFLCSSTATAKPGFARTQTATAARRMRRLLLLLLPLAAVALTSKLRRQEGLLPARGLCMVKPGRRHAKSKTRSDCALLVACSSRTVGILRESQPEARGSAQGKHEVRVTRGCRRPRFAVVTRRTLSGSKILSPSRRLPTSDHRSAAALPQRLPQVLFTNVHALVTSAFALRGIYICISLCIICMRCIDVLPVFAAALPLPQLARAAAHLQHRARASVTTYTYM